MWTLLYATSVETLDVQSAFPSFSDVQCSSYVALGFSSLYWGPIEAEGAIVEDMVLR